jgi:hypothetical protein
MGITVHYETRFVGTKNQLKKKLNVIAERAKELGFKEYGEVYEMNFANDFNTRDAYTPTYKDEETGKFEIDGAYRWAKIQATPRTGFVELNKPLAVQQKQRREIEKIRERTLESHGFVLNLWWGEGCEPTNMPFVAYRGDGPSTRRTWKGNSFTKTQYAEDFTKAHIAVCLLLKEAEAMGLIKEVYDEAEFYESGDLTILIDNGEENLRMIQAFSKQLQSAFPEGDIVTQDIDEKVKEFDLG